MSYLFDRCHFTHSQVDQDLFLTLQQTLFSTLQLSGNRQLAHKQLNLFLLQFCRRAREKQRLLFRAPERKLDALASLERGMRRYTTNKNKLHRVRGGCLGAEGRRRTRRPAKRSGGAACKR